LRREHQLAQDDVERITLYVPQGHLKVCNIPNPDTGLEVKFSLRHTAALALAGEDTAALDTYSDAIANRADLVALRDKVDVQTKSFPRQSPASVDIVLRHGETVSKTLDVGEPARDLKAQWARLTHKFHSLVDPILGVEAANACIDQCASLEEAADLHTLLAQASS
jgi:hypothetical protein